MFVDFRVEVFLMEKGVKNMRGLGTNTNYLINAAKRMLAQFSNPIPLRGLYYQLVSHQLIENNQPSYKRLVNAMTKARELGEIPWDAFIDNTRRKIEANGWEDLASYVENLPHYYRRDRLQTQPVRLEIWVEKEALAHVFEPYVQKYGVIVRIGRGYQSGSALNQFAKDMKHDERSAKILYFGDWDPSGLDIDRSFTENLDINFGIVPVIERVALIEEDTKHLPPNPAKLTDKRAQAYMEKFGNKTWELDAMSQNDLKNRINSAIQTNIDFAQYEMEMESEKRERDEFSAKLAELSE